MIIFSNVCLLSSKVNRADFWFAHIKVNNKSEPQSYIHEPISSILVFIYHHISLKTLLTFISWVNLKKFFCFAEILTVTKRLKLVLWEMTLGVICERKVLIASFTAQDDVQSLVISVILSILTSSMNVCLLKDYS